MLIPITRPSPSSIAPPLPPNLIKLGSTLLLLELQGSLEVFGTPEDGEGGGVVGELRMTGEKARLQIGHHLLEGKIVTLPKPLVVLRKRIPTSLTSQPSFHATEEDDPSAKDEDNMSVETGGEGGTSYEVVEVVRKKVVFARRPALVMGKPAANGAGVRKP